MLCRGLHRGKEKGGQERMEASLQGVRGPLKKENEAKRFLSSVSIHFFLFDSFYAKMVMHEAKIITVFCSFTRSITALQS